FPEQRDSKHRTISANALGITEFVVGIGEHIVNMDGSSFEHGLPGDCSWANRDRMALHVLIEVRRETMARDSFVEFGFWTTDDCVLGLAQTRCRFDQRVEHGR